MNRRSLDNLPVKPLISFKGALSRTLPEFKDECDINHIIKSFNKTGVMSSIGQKTTPPTFGDFSEMGDFTAHQNAIVAAQSAFDALPSALRTRFGNNPAELIKFVMDENNREEAVRLGLVTFTPPPAPSSEEMSPAGQPESAGTSTTIT